MSGNAKGYSEEEARARLAAIVESSDDAIIGKTLDGVITSWNKGAEKIYGYRAEEAVGRHVSMLAPPERQVELRQLLERLQQGEQITQHETERVTKDGRRIEVAITISPIRGGDGSVIGCSTIARDITKHKRLERQLRENEKRYQTQIELAADAIVVLQNGRFVYANCAALGLYAARSLEKLQERSVLDLVHPEERVAVRTRYQRLLRGADNPLRECRLLRLTGEVVPVETSSVLIDYQGQPSIQVIARDISRRKKAEAELEALLQELRLQRAQFETVLRQMPIGVMIAEAPSGRVIYNNEASVQIFRHENPRVEGLDDYEKWPAYRLDGTRLAVADYPVVRALLCGERVIGEELQIVRGDGSRAVVSVNAAPISDNDGRIVSAVAAFTDITEQIGAVEALRQSEERLKLALDATGMGFCDMDVRSGLGTWNRRQFRLLGFPAPETGEGPASMDMWLQAIHPEDREPVHRAMADARTTHALCRSEYRIIRADNGKPRWMNLLGRYGYDAAGEPVNFIGVIFDVTERKRAEQTLKDEVAEKLQAIEDLHRQEQMLIRQGRLAALGEMIGNIAHQWRQPLNTLGLIVQELSWYYDHDKLTKEYLDASVTRGMQVINHMSKTIDGFRNFFDSDKQKQDFKVGEVLTQTVAMVEAAFHELRIRIEVLAEPDIVVNGSPNEFSQVILNLLVNAKDALLERKVPQPMVEVRLSRENGRVVLTIADNAGGIPAEIMDKIFDPYFTTKGPDRGTGIGLFMSKTIIEKNMHGALSVRNTKTGAEFRIEV